ncbi:hypothetical protein ASD39_07550 [Sphingomonas sp. Root50]|nr:hypothetical protein ASD17_05575 [Sphingomonas sp. Root1294]KQY67772.1 hypothetical protein ASD39_07550 [Sphingomonas sp. Root50]KRB88694.1 hypothetical protein ASE22_19900 [Sphingomonas sp. Root720]
MKDVLHVGCGRATIEKMTPGFQRDWREIRFDIDPGVEPDIVGTTTDMEAVADGSVDAVYSSHNIEHVYAHQVKQVLGEFRRVLKPDGFLVVTCPDIQPVARFVAEGKLTEPLYISPAGPISALDILYGHGKAIENGQEYMAHRTAFTVNTLGAAMRSAGFRTTGIRKYGLELWAIGVAADSASDLVIKLMADYLPSKLTPQGAVKVA